jgi:hypothetical protein
MEVAALTLRKYPRARVLLTIFAPQKRYARLEAISSPWHVLNYMPVIAPHRKKRLLPIFMFGYTPPSTFTVPNVVNPGGVSQTQAEAVFLLNAAGFLSTPITQAPSLLVVKGYVISQNPPAGTVETSLNTPVALVISSGPPVLTPVWVKAITAGYYKGIYREIGDVFQLDSINDLSNYLVDQDPGSADSPVWGWMMLLAGNPMPILGYSSQVRVGSQSPRRTVL